MYSGIPRTELKRRIYKESLLKDLDFDFELQSILALNENPENVVIQYSKKILENILEKF